MNDRPEWKCFWMEPGWIAENSSVIQSVLRYQRGELSGTCSLVQSWDKNEVKEFCAERGRRRLVAVYKKQC